MEGPSGADSATLLARLLPADVADRVIGFLEPADADLLRRRLAQPPAGNDSAAEPAALNAFFDLLRILARPVAAGPPVHRSIIEANGHSASKAGAAHGSSNEPSDTVATLRGLDSSVLARALDEEQPAAAAMILSRLDSTQAADILKRLSPARRSDIAVRLTQAGSVDHVLVERLGRAVLEKAQKIAALPPQPSAEERTRAMAAMIRRLDRPERADVLGAIEKADPKTVALIRQEMFRFDDLLRVEDRALQGLIAELDAKTLALALKGSPEAIAEKILRNTSSRGRQALTDEIALLGNVQKNVIAEAQTRVVDVLRKLEEEGKITIES